MIFKASQQNEHQLWVLFSKTSAQPTLSALFYAGPYWRYFLAFGVKWAKNKSGINFFSLFFENLRLELDWLKKCKN